MRPLLTATALAASILLTACSTPESEPSQAPQPAAASETAPSRPQAPLRPYTSQQIVQVLGGLQEAKGSKPSTVLSHEDILAQSNVNSGLTSALTPKVTPESCAHLVNLAPTVVEKGITTGSAMFVSDGTQVAVSAAVDSVAGHGKRAKANNSALKQCGEITMKIADQVIKLSMKPDPLTIEAENSLAVRASGQVAGAELKMVTFTASTGSVMINGAAFSSANFDESAVLQDLARMAKEALDRFAELPQAPASGTSPSASVAATPTGSDGAAASSAGGVRDAAQGLWTGPVTGDSTAYNVKASIKATSEGLTADVEYPELGCTATWKETAIEGTSISLLESLESGKCLDNVKVTITKDAETWLAFFDGGTGENIQAVLRK